MLEPILAGVGAGLFAFFKGNYGAEFAGAVGERFLQTVWGRYRERGNSDFDRLAAAALAEAAEKASAHQNERHQRAFWRDSQKKPLVEIKRSAADRFLKRQGDPEQAVLDALLVGHFESIEERLAMMLGPELLPETLADRPEMLRVLAESFLESFSTLLKVETHTKGRRAFHRDLAWATHRAVSDLRAELAPLVQVDWEAVLARLEDFAEERVDPPNLTVYFKHVLEELRSISGRLAVVDETTKRAEVAIDGLPERVGAVVEARLASALERYGIRLDAGEEIQRLTDMLGETRAVILGLLGGILDADVDPTQLDVTVPKALERLRSTQAELVQLQQRASHMPPIADALATAQAALSKGDLIDLPATQEALRLARVQYIAAIQEQHEQEAETLAEMLETEGLLALACMRFPDAAGLFAEAAASLPASRHEQRWRLELRRAQALYEAAEMNPEQGALLEVVTLLRTTVLELAPRLERPLAWAATQNGLGAALLVLGEMEPGTTRLEEAVAAHQEALEELARERVPLPWAATQDSLGHALFRLGQRELGTARLKEAVAAYREALKEHTRERVPLDWATTQNSLGNALGVLGERESETTRLEEAVAAHREALKEHTRERAPLLWAMTLSGLGTALQVLGERELLTTRFEEALAAYQEALEELTRERRPLDWATAQNNLGNTLCCLGALESDTARLEEAVAAYREALKERLRERVPLDWAATQNNLGHALCRLGELEPGTTRLEEAIAAYQEVLKEYIREQVPLLWATTQINLGDALHIQWDREQQPSSLHQALAAHLAAWAESRGHAEHYASIAATGVNTDLTQLETAGLVPSLDPAACELFQQFRAQQQRP